MTGDRGAGPAIVTRPRTGPGPTARRGRQGRQGRRRRWLPDDEPVAPLDIRLVPAALAVWGGCLLVLWGGATAALPVAVGSAAVALGLGARAMVSDAFGRRRWWLGTLAAAVCLAAAAGSTTLRTAEIRAGALFLAATAGGAGTGRVTVAADPVRLPAGPGGTARFLVRGELTEWTATSVAQVGRVPVTVFGDGDAWSGVLPGEQLTAPGRIGVDAFTSWPTVSVQATGPPETVAPPPWWQRAATDFRERFTAVAAGTGGNAAGLLPGIVLGDRTGIPPALTQDAKITGLTHLLAVSGSHFVVLCGVVLLVLRRFGPRTAAVGGLVFAVALVIVVRPSPSVLRAAVMGGLTLLALMTGRHRSTVPALAAAVVVLLLLDPALAEDAGFALSVQATAAIVLVAPRWTAALERRGWPTGWANLLTVPAVAQLGTMPVVAGLSGGVSVWALPANMAVSPAVPVALILGALAAVLTGWWDGAASFVAGLAAPAAEWIATCAHVIAGWPLAVVPWPSSPGGVLGLAVLVVGVPLTLTVRRLRVAATAAVLVAAAVLVPTTVVSGGWPPPGWTAVGCDIGQGDGFAVATGVPGEAVVVDTGPEPSVMDRCLDRLDVTRVPLLVVTHLHADHVGGLDGVLAGRRVDRVGVGPGREPAAAWRDIGRSAAAAGVPVAQLTLGTRLTVGRLLITVLGPDPARVPSFLGPNDQSLVLRIENGTSRMLFTGDIEDDAQRALVASGADLRADVLKLPHHGSANVRPEFLQAVGARIVLIGVGADNDFGHPTAVALRLARDAGAELILRTDTDGDIAVTDHGGTLAGIRRGAAVIPARRRAPGGVSGRRGRGRRRGPRAPPPVPGPADRPAPGPAGGGPPTRPRRTARPRAGRDR